MANISPEQQAALDLILSEWARNWEKKSNWIRFQMSYLQHKVNELAEKEGKETDALGRVKE
jgi:hypothetical protein